MVFKIYEAEVRRDGKHSNGILHCAVLHRSEPGICTKDILQDQKERKDQRERVDQKERKDQRGCMDQRERKDQRERVEVQQIHFRSLSAMLKLFDKAGYKALLPGLRKSVVNGSECMTIPFDDVCCISFYKIIVI